MKKLLFMIFVFFIIEAKASDREYFYAIQRDDFQNKNAFLEGRQAKPSEMQVSQDVLSAHALSELKEPSNALLYYMFNAEANVVVKALAPLYQKNQDYQFIYLIKKASYDEARKIIPAVISSNHSRILNAQFSIYAAELMVALNKDEALKSIENAKISAPATSLEEAALRRKIIFALSGRTRLNIRDVYNYARLFHESIYANRIFDAVGANMTLNYKDYVENTDQLIFLLSYLGNRKKEILIKIIINSLVNDERDITKKLLDNIHKYEKEINQDQEYLFLSQIYKSLSCLNKEYAYNLSALSLTQSQNKTLYYSIADFYGKVNDIISLKSDDLNQCREKKVDFNDAAYIKKINSELQNISHDIGF